MWISLDVGCGMNPKGEVNVDAYPRVPERHKNWNPKQIENFVLADATHLPFKNNSFKQLFATHVLEHLHNPLEAVKEWKRVALVVLISVPSAYDLDTTDTHCFTWNEYTLKNMLCLIFANVKVGYTGLHPQIPKRLVRYIPVLRMVAKRFPRELRAVCW